MTKKTAVLEAVKTGLIVFTFEDNTTETFDMAKTPEETQKILAFHGASQKIGDSYAGASAAADPLGYAKEAVKDTIAQLYAGQWRVSVSAGPRISDLAAAVAKVSGQSLEECRKIIENLDDNQRKVLRKQPKVAAALAGIAAEKAAERAKAAEKAAADAPALEGFGA